MTMALVLSRSRARLPCSGTGSYAIFAVGRLFLSSPRLRPPSQQRWSSHSPLTVQSGPARKKVTLSSLQAMYKKGEPIAVMTAHDFPSAHVADAAGMDIILVGDSLAMVALGMQDTSEVTVEDMLLHCRSVARATRAAFTVGDLPMGSYEISPEQALETAIEFVKQGRVQGIKLEGGKEMAPAIAKITQAGIPVLAHVGLTPQRQHSLGGFKVQGKTSKGAMRVLDDALAVQEAGSFAMVVEAVPAEVATIITQKLSIPTIGIGAGNGCSGQVLVQVDMSGYFPPGRFIPKFVKKYGDVWAESYKAIECYREEVKARRYPAPEHTYPIVKEELQAFIDGKYTTASNFCAACILRTSCLSCGADPTALKRISTRSRSNSPALARAELASRGSAVSTAEAVMVSGSSGDPDRSGTGEAGGDGEDCPAGTPVGSISGRVRDSLGC
ncbi:ketopantoate hydroxymethyltransferase-domain-containing protein [Durotheca rogersii]|uniref:ketopantoate hydroxymethyltransferase-domain-containing protein n=1 Tax=Durotheca rogersii TaxID=419775 RepID=UPI002220C825|nr:ketopantoate hydroxymethyltransferase-domain-containing protein [Durotheca rogersii]KAI5856697.1 ketopantoate hydroxymethyltransferase-domain-containing protein [Durotheca rogersii]